MQDLFAELPQNNSRATPLAARLRPAGLDEVVGQEHILAPGSLLRRSIEADQLGSVIFYGPSGTGKTTLALVISQITKATFVSINAVTSGVAEIREIVKTAKERLAYEGRGTIVFIDEIHRFNKSQQDALLPSVEDGKIVLIGATTENPYFSINSALISRSRIFRLYPLTQEDVLVLLQRALEDKEKGLGLYKTEVTSEALEHFAAKAGGDARIALNALELAVRSTLPNEQGLRVIDLNTAEESIQARAVIYDKSGDQHYDVISAFIKSIRGSDANAALHYLARMIEAGEDMAFIVRRLQILAAEDVGPAEPWAMSIISGAAQSFFQVGLPEGRIILANAVIYLCNAPKSNGAYIAIDKALKDVREGNYGPVPPHLRDGHYPGAAKLGHGLGYLYPHDFGGYVKQGYLPDQLSQAKYYRPTGIGADLGPIFIKKESATD